MLRTVPTPMADSAAERLQRLAAVAVLLGALLSLVLRASCAPDVAFLSGDDWLTSPREVDARVQQWGAPHVPIATFTRRFDLERIPAAAWLLVEAGRAHRVLVNGVLVEASGDPDPGWRRGHRIDVAAGLRAGGNEIQIEVWNPRGPPLLRARFEDAALEAGAHWSVAVDAGAPAAAVVPDDTRPHPSASAGPRPARALREHAVLVAGLFVLASVILGVGESWFRAHRARLPWIALALVHVGWFGLFAGKLVTLPVTTGFDAQHHLAYVEYLRRERALPLPTDGWSTYHPPLYYAAVALLEEVAGSDPHAHGLVTRVPSFAAGLASVWASFGLGRLLLAGRPELVAVAVLFTGVLPLEVYTAAYVSNEPLHAALFSLATLVGVGTLLRRRIRVRDAAWLGAAVGVALLAKVSALLLAACAGFFVLARVVQREGLRAGRLAAVGLAYAAPIALISGWFYLRNLRLHGALLVGNWNLPGQPWWSQPGFHTPAYYMHFGASLTRPILAGFQSFWDALYASFWADGWIAGRASAAFPVESWNWDFMVLGVWLGLPATVVLAWGIARMACFAFDPAQGPRRVAWSFLLSLLAAVMTALVALTLDLPYFGQAKAPYLLGLVPTFALAFALGADACDRCLAQRAGVVAARGVRAVWLVTAGVLWLGFAA